MALLLLASLYLGYSDARAGTYFSAPLDDTFIHFKYAKQLARGELLHFNDGDSATTGATSVLYMVLLAPGWLFGFRGLLLLLWAWLVNGALHVRAGVALFNILRRTSGGGLAAPYGGMLVFLCCGPLLWGVFSQMEIALFSSLILLSLEAAVDLEAQDAADSTPPGGRWTPRRRVLVYGSLLALTRPEGSLLAGGLSLWLVWRHLGERGEGESWKNLIRRGITWLWPLTSGVALTLFLAALTGRLGTNANIKSHLTLLPYETARYWETSLRHLPMTMQILLEKLPSFTAPVTTLLCLVGVAAWAAKGRLRRPGAGILVLGWLLLLTLFYAFLMARRDHFDRYYLPYMGLIVASLFWPLARLAASRPPLRRAPAYLAGLLLLFMAPDTLFQAQRFGDNCRDLAHQHFRVAAWVKKNLPASARIAVNDAGAIPYLGERYAYDIVGLGHNAFYKVKKHIIFSDAPAWEALEDLEQKPDYFVAYPEWLPQMNHLPFFEVVKRFPLANRTVVANETKIVWRMHWDKLARSDLLPESVMEGLQVVDRLDVAKVSSEETHDYHRLSEVAPRGDLRQQGMSGGKFMVEGGRPIETGESEQFDMACAQGKAAVLVLRASGPGRIEMDVKVNGEAAGRWLDDLGPGMALTRTTIDSNLLDGDGITVRLTARRPYTSYHYWLLQ